MSIQKLPQDLINKIAAGEVVTRPSSVVKELIENSIDAGSSSIRLEISKAGIELLKITDNGNGMNREDLRLAIEPHSTSKILSINDLFALDTFGFRGEALASISAVSDFEIRTKQKGELEGSLLSFPTHTPEISICSCAEGTEIVVKNLFYNVPARKKFLKSYYTEYNKILEAFTDFSIMHPEIQFILIKDGKEVLHYTACTEHERIGQVLGKSLSENLLPISVDVKGMKIGGYIGKPHIATSSRSNQYIFVNNRSIKDAMIQKAIRSAYGTLVFRDNQPVYILKLSIDPKQVDVNVHPQKREVRFNNSQEVFLSILDTIKMRLSETDLTPNLDIQTPQSKGNYEPITRESFVYKPKYSEQIKRQSTTTQPIQSRHDSVNLVRELITAEKEVTPEPTASWKLLGQVHKAYILVESSNGMMIIDQHAAGERLLFEKFKKEHDEKEIKTQQLLTPEVFDVSPTQTELLNNSLNIFSDLGFDIEYFGGQSYRINGVPQDIVNTKQSKQIIEGLLDDIADPEYRNLSTLEEKINHVIETAACRAAVKFNDHLTEPEQLQLISDIQKLNGHYTCPHGRPFLFELTMEDLEKRFKRK